MTTLTFGKINGTGAIAKGSAPLTLSGTSDDIGGVVTIALDPVDDPGVTTPQTLSATVAADGTWSVLFDPSTVPEAQYTFAASVAGATAYQDVYVGSPVAQFIDDNSGVLQTKLAAGGRYLVEISNGQAYRVDLQTGQRVLASADASGTVANAAVSDVAISADGRYVAFDTAATNLGTGLTGEEEVWRKDLSTGQLTLISVDSTGTPGNNTPAETNGTYLLSQSYSSLIGMTPDGSHVFYNTNQENLVGDGPPSDGTFVSSPVVVTAVMRATVGNGPLVDGLPTAATVSTNDVFLQSYDLANLPPYSADPNAVAEVAVYNSPGAGGITFDIADPRGYAIVTGFSDDGSKVSISYDAERPYGSSAVSVNGIDYYISTYYDISSVVAGDGSSIVNAGPSDPGAVAVVSSTSSTFYALGDQYGSILSGDGSTILVYRDTGNGYAIPVGPQVELGDGLAYYSDNGQTLYYAMPSTAGVFFSTPLAVAYNTVTGQLVLSAINGNGSVFEGSTVNASTNQNVTLLYSNGATYFSSGGVTQWNDGQGFYVTYSSPAPMLRPQMAGGKFAFVHQGSGPATLSGTSDAIGQQVEIDVGSAGAGSAFATVAADGTWSASVAQSLITTGVAVYVSVTSAAGTPTLDTGTAQLIAAPTTPVLTPFTTPTNLTQPYVSGTADAGDTVTVYDGTGVLGTATVSRYGDFTYQITTPLSAGLHRITAVASDALGDLSAASTEQDVTIDLTPPAETVATLVAAGDNVVSVAEQVSGLMTVTGTLSAPLAAGDIVEVVVAGNGMTVQATASVGSTTFTASVPIPALSGQVQAYVQDAAGNQTATTTQAFTVTPVNAVKRVIPLSTDYSDSTPSLSQTGAYVAFVGTPQFSGPSIAPAIEVANLATGTVVDASGGLANVSAPSLSGDGSEVALISADSATDTPQVYVETVASGATALVSHAAGSTAAANGRSLSPPSLSEDGQHVVFASNATNLTTDTVAGFQVYEADLAAGAWTVKLVSSGAAGSASDDAYEPSVSADGRVVAFSSAATNLLDGVPDTGFDEVYATMFDAEGHATVELVSSNAAGVAAADGYSDAGVVSGNGRYVVFQSTADNLLPGASTSSQIYRKDLVTGAVVLVSADAEGNAGTDNSYGATVSDDGNLVAFETHAPNLCNASGIAEFVPLQVVVKNLTTGELRLASSGSAVDSASSVSGAVMAGDGSVVAFASSAQDLVAGTTGGQTQVYTSAPLAACYAEGTMILTPHGEYPIETLQPGDQVVTAGGYRRPIIWTGHRHVALAGHPRPWDVMPVRIVADAFACGQPLRDLVVSPDHAVLADGVLIPIRYLLNGATIMQEETRRITWWHVELDAHDAILAEGLPAESYLDTGNRSAFVGEAVTALRPDFSRDVWARSGCAPLAVDGPVVAAVRRRLLDRMAELGHHLTADPAITLHAGGRIWRPRRHGRWTRFVAPDGNQTLRIRSRQFRPAELDPSGTDWRVLGIAVTALRLDGQDIQLDSPVFAEGWHPGKDALRWSDGDGALNVPPGTVVDLLVADFPRYHADATAPYRGLRVGT